MHLCVYLSHASDNDPTNLRVDNHTDRQIYLWKLSKFVQHNQLLYYKVILL